MMSEEVADKVENNVLTQSASSISHKRNMDAASVSGSDAESSADETKPGETQGRKRKRSSKISCELCKLRKVKCDKAEPA